MAEKIALYLMNLKGFRVLEGIIKKGLVDNIAFVCLGRDAKVLKDYGPEIEELCLDAKLGCYERGSEPAHDHYKMAIGWRWMMASTEKLIVFHDSALPKYRGFSPVVSALVNGEGELGATALFASDHYDQGPIIKQKIWNISYPIRVEEAIEQMANAYLEMTLDLLKMIIAGEEIAGIPQDEERATYSVWLDEEDYDLDWSLPATQLKRFIDAKSFPYRGARSGMNGSLVRVLEAETEDIPKLENNSPGKVLFIDDGEPLVLCGEGAIRIKNLIAEEDGRQLLPLRRLKTRFHRV